MNNTSYIILNFDPYMLKKDKKSNQTLKFNVTNKIKVDTIIINKVVYMTHLNKNELHLTIRIMY